MPDGSRYAEQQWKDVGVHPTPRPLVREFARSVVAALVRRHKSGRGEIRVLDACAGDGRLGHAVSKRLKRLGFRPCLTLVEATTQSASPPAASYQVETVACDFYAYTSEAQFDLIVSNPPYLAISKATAKRFGFHWNEVLAGGRNLYGLALARCLLLCRPGGLIGFLGPHGWVMNNYAAQLRTRIAERVDQIEVFAFSSRRLFPNVHQDVAIQVLSVGVVGPFETTLAISYDGGASTSIQLCEVSSVHANDHARVRVGAFVWNRQADLLSRRPGAGLPVLYGGNISASGELNFSVSRYVGRQHVARSRLPPEYIVRSPCIALKRSMRGYPGRWELDLVVIDKAGFAFVPENHVIVIEFDGGLTRNNSSRLAKALKQKIETDHRHHGHPNLSVALVKKAISAVMKQRGV